MIISSPYWHLLQGMAALLARRAREVGAGAEELAIVAAYRAALLGEARAARRPPSGN